MSHSNNYDFVIKLLLIGDSGVGKSCLLLKFAEDSFTPSFLSTIGIDYKIKTIKINNKTIKLQIWDTAGQERFRTITTAYYRGAMGILLVYDITNLKSFENIINWINNIESNSNDQVKIILLGNKFDIGNKRIVETLQGKNLAKKYNIDFFETSAKTGFNVDNAFMSITKEIFQNLTKKESFNTKDIEINLKDLNQDVNSKNKCCN